MNQLRYPYNTLSHRMMRLCRRAMYFNRDHYRIHMAHEDGYARGVVKTGNITLRERPEYELLQVDIYAMFDELHQQNPMGFLMVVFMEFMLEQVDPVPQNHYGVSGVSDEVMYRWNDTAFVAHNGRWTSVGLNRLGTLIRQFENILDDYEDTWPNQLLLLRLSA